MAKRTLHRLKSGFFRTPLRIVIAVGVVVFFVEFILMELLHDLIIPNLPFVASDRIWGAVDAIMLILLVSPTLYYLVFMRMRQNLNDLSLLVTGLTDSLGIGVLMVDKDCRIHRWNQWMVNKTGITSDQACGKLLTELFKDFNSPRLLSAIELCINHKSPQLISQTLNRFVLPIPTSIKGHEMMQQQVSVAPLNDCNGKVLAIISINDVTENVAKSAALTQLAMKLESQSNRDQLTGAYNRHFLWTWLEPQIKQCTRHGNALGCLMLDIDHFKSINDSYGHDVGDEVLRVFSNLLNELLRESDVLVRYGGEEFVALLPHADPVASLEIANRILDIVRNSSIHSLRQGEVRCSIGISCWTEDTPWSAEELLKEADLHLYQAKNSGRDRVVM